jgi:HK97 family phage major capsid protein
MNLADKNRQAYEQRREAAEREGLSTAEFLQRESARETSELVKGAVKHYVSEQEALRARGNMRLIGRDTHDLPAWRPEGDSRGAAVLEARHDLKAYLSQSPNYNPSGIDFGSFDRDAFWFQALTGKREGREWRALAEGAQSSTVTGAGVLVPLEFAANVLQQLRANLVFTSPGANGAINGPQVVDMQRQIEYVPTWTGDGAGVTSYIAENTTMTPGTATLGRVTLNAYTMANVSLMSRQLLADTNTTGGLANLLETNLAAAMARGMDTSALYGTGTGQPAGILTSAYSGSVQAVSMGTNGAAPTNYDQVSQAIEKVRIANDEPSVVATNPQVYGTYSRLKNTLNDALRPGQDVLDYWPPRYSTAFSATETQGTSNAASSALVLNANRVILGLRQGFEVMVADQRWIDALQVGVVCWLRHDWNFPYSAAAARVLGILTT